MSESGIEVSEQRAEDIRQEIKELALERERLVAENADPKSIAGVLKDIAALAAEGNNIARVLRARREADEKQDAQRAEQSDREALSDIEARYQEEKAALIEQRRVDQ